MGDKILIGNLSTQASFGKLQDLLSDVGTIQSIRFIGDSDVVKSEINLGKFFDIKDPQLTEFKQQAVTLCAFEMASPEETEAAVIHLETVQLPSVANRPILLYRTHGSGDKP